MKTRILKITAAVLTAMLLFTLFPISDKSVKADAKDQELREFVTRLYKVCLKRDPEDGGLDFWTNELKSKNQTGVAVSSGFIFSPELQDKSYSNEEYVNIMYDAFFGREADADGFNFWVKSMNDGMSRLEIFTGFANSNEFFELCNSFDVTAGTFLPAYDSVKVNRTNFFVERLYNVVLGRKCDKDGMLYWTQELLDGRISGTKAAYGFFFSPEYENGNKFYSGYINDLYNALMGRASDDEGREFWSTQMKDGSTKEHVFNGFAMSAEFSLICSDYGILQGDVIPEERDTTYTLRPDEEKGSEEGKITNTPSTKAEPTKKAENKPTEQVKADPTKKVENKPTTAPSVTKKVSEPTKAPSALPTVTSAPAATSSPAVTSAPAATTEPTATPVPTVPVIEGLKVKNAYVKIQSGCSGQIEFTDKNGKTVKPQGAEYKSDNEAVAVVCPDGAVIGLSVGSATVTITYGSENFNVFVSVEKYVSSITSVPNALTPQEFGANGNDDKDDTEAFRKMFAEAVGQSYTIGKSGWRHCPAIYIPSGRYKISGAIFDQNIKPTNDKPLRYCMFEIFGAGRESTVIDFSGEVLFDARTSGDAALFAFTTIRDINFRGNNSNTFMNMTVTNNDGQQRMQFFSCGFGAFKTILDVLKTATHAMNSEITFAYCKIANCGSESDRCKLFILTNPQAVNWRFDNTDIEAFTGDAFYFTTGTGVTINNGSIIPGPGGCVFNFAINDQNNLGGGNAPHVLVIGARFEIHPGKTLLKTNSNSQTYPKVAFQYCNVNAAASPDSISTDWMIIKGGADIVFDTCYKCSYSRFYVDCTSFTGYVQPKVKFINCPDIKVDNVVKGSTVVSDKSTLDKKNTLQITIDDAYDFYLLSSEDGYFHTTSDLKQCRQIVDINSDNNDDYNSTKITNGKTLKAKPYGFVEYVEITVTKSETWKGYPVNVTLYDGSRKISDTVKIDFSESKTYQIPVKNFSSSEDNNWVNELGIKFTHSYSSGPQVNMNVTIVKK